MNNEQMTALKARLTRTEDRRVFPYDDATGKTLQQGDVIKGNISIGVGANLMIGLYPEEIDFILENRIKKAEADAATLPAYAKLDPVRQTVLVDMVFNMGIGSVRNFRNTLGYMEAGDYKAAARGMRNSLWARQVGPRAEELAQIMESGSYEGSKGSRDVEGFQP